MPFSSFGGSGLDPKDTGWKDSVRAATTASVANLSSVSVTVDGVTLIEKDRVLVKDTASADGSEALHAKRNGIYTVGTVGGFPPSAAFTRATDCSTADSIEGAAVLVEEGTANGGNSFRQTATGTALETTALAWVELVPSTKTMVVTVSDPTTLLTAGTNKARIPIPSTLNGKTITRAQATCAVAGAGATTTIQLYNLTTTANVLASGLLLAASGLVGTPVAGTATALNTDEVLRVDITGSPSTFPTGLELTIDFA